MGPQHRGQAAQQPEYAHDLETFGGRVEDLDDRQDLGRHHGRCRALDQAGQDQQLGRRGQAAAQRGQGKTADAETEDAAITVDIAQASAGDQQHGKGQGIAGHDPFDGRGAGVQIAANGGNGDIDDGQVEDFQHKGRGDDGDRQFP